MKLPGVVLHIAQYRVISMLATFLPSWNIPLEEIKQVQPMCSNVRASLLTLLGLLGNGGDLGMHLPGLTFVTTLFCLLSTPEVSYEQALDIDTHPSSPC